MHYFRGFKDMRRNNFAGAVAELKLAYDSQGREVNNNYELANAYARAEDIPAAKWAYEEALKSNAGYDEIYFNLAIVRKRLGDTAAALDGLKVSAFINPLNHSVYTALSEIYLKDGARYAEEGAEIFRTAADVFPEDPGILNTLGYFYTLMKDYRAARDVYARGVRTSPGNAALIQNLVGTAAQLGAKNDPDVLWLGKFQAVQQRLAVGDVSRSSLAAADALVGLEPENPNSLALRARLNFKAGDDQQARRDLLKTLKARPEDNDARYGLAVIYEKEGDFRSARREWETLLQSEPGNAAVAERLKNLPR
jgi:Flp pilus assembly protein TadD